MTGSFLCANGQFDDGGKYRKLFGTNPSGKGHGLIRSPVCFSMISRLLVVILAIVLPIEETGKKKTEREDELMTTEAMAS